MKKYLVYSLAGFALASCASVKTSKPVDRKSPYTVSVKAPEGSKKYVSKEFQKPSATVKELISDAEKYIGAPYKFGGDTSAGFDCSGFTSKVFMENNIKLPRRSVDQSATGDPVPVEHTKAGDLLFFATSGGTRVSHVGIVHDIGDDGEIKFIHASTSKGVVISSLNEKYWNNAFLFARRTL